MFDQKENGGGSKKNKSKSVVFSETSFQRRTVAEQLRNWSEAQEVG